tara:strand:+ start:438 stop:1193 length:756 start_codon:yes stop_codon:yes gene_type:complete
LYQNKKGGLVVIEFYNLKKKNKQFRYAFIMLSIFTFCLIQLSSNILNASTTLGKRYIEIGGGYVLPGDECIIKEWDPVLLGYAAGINLPLNKHLDGGISFSQLIVDGKVLGSHLRSTGSELSGSLTYSFSPNQLKNPYLRISYGSTNTTLTNKDTSYSESSSVNSYSVSIGSELFYDLDVIFNNKKDRKLGSFLLTPEISYTKIDDLDSAVITPSLGYGIWFIKKYFWNQTISYEFEDGDFSYETSFLILF